MIRESLKVNQSLISLDMWLLCSANIHILKSSFLVPPTQKCCLFIWICRTSLPPHLIAGIMICFGFGVLPPLLSRTCKNTDQMCSSRYSLQSLGRVRFLSTRETFVEFNTWCKWHVRTAVSNIWCPLFAQMTSQAPLFIEGTKRSVNRQL